MQKYLFKKMKPSEYKCLLPLCIILGIYLLESLPFINIGGTSYFVYIIKPLLWLAAIFSIWLLPRVRASSKLRYQGFLKSCVVYLAIFYILFLFLGGVIEGFGRSPYDLSPIGIIKNILVLGSALIGRELVRAYLVSNLVKDRPIFTMTIITLLMTALNIPFFRVANLKGGFETLQYLGETILPELSRNILLTYLVFIAGASPAIIYLAILQGVFWFSPILPNLNWITKSLIGMACPIFSLMFIQYIYLVQSKKLKRRYAKNENPLGWIVTTIFSIGIIWFAIGVFPVQPSVIATGSMEPMIKPGDVIIVDKKHNKDLKIGDVIQFKKDNIYISHRIIDIIEEKKQIKYRTKGDNNSVWDSDLVTIEEVKGRIIYVVPKIGWPTLLLKGRSEVPREKVEF